MEAPAPGTLPAGLAEHQDYSIIRELGRGGMGVVYLAHNRLMGRDEVLKVVGRAVLDRAGVLDRFLREIRSVATLRHPNIVTAYTAFRLGESFVFAMEYVEGLDLARMVKTKGPLPVPHACAFVHQAALGLQHAHEQGMVHRDIKPGNLMLSRREGKSHVQILDFGLAKVAREEPSDGGLTHEGQMLGTPDFIAPEQSIDAQKADIRADIYSLGCTLYYLLTGSPPFRATSLYEILQAHHSIDARPVNLIRPEVSVELAAVIAKMLAKEPARRYQTPREVARALTPFFKKGSSAAPSSAAELSQARPAGEQEIPPRNEAVRTQAGTQLMPAESSAGTVEQVPTGVSKWASLLELPEIDHATVLPAAVARPRRPQWMWPAVTAAAVLAVFVAAWAAGVFKTKTMDGTIVLENIPEEAELFVDGAKVTLQWPRGGKPLEITVPAGKRGIQVKKDGFTTFGQEVTVEAGDSKAVRVTLVPLQAPPESQVTAADAAVPPDHLAPAAPAQPTPPERPVTAADASKRAEDSRPPTTVQLPAARALIDVRPPGRKASIPLPRNTWIVLDAANARINGVYGKVENGLVMLYPPHGQGNNASWTNPSIHARNMRIKAQVKKSNWDDGTMGLTLRFNPQTWESYSATLAKHNPRQGYSFRIEKHFAKTERRKPHISLQGSGNRPVPGLEIDDFFELGFSAINDTLTITVNGKRVVQARDPDFKSGSVMVQAWQCRPIFKDVQIKILDD